MRDANKSVVALFSAASLGQWESGVVGRREDRYGDARGQIAEMTGRIDNKPRGPISQTKGDLEFKNLQRLRDFLLSPSRKKKEKKFQCGPCIHLPLCDSLPLPKVFYGVAYRNRQQQRMCTTAALAGGSLNRHIQVHDDD